MQRWGQLVNLEIQLAFIYKMSSAANTILQELELSNTHLHVDKLKQAFYNRKKNPKTSMDV